MSSGAGPVVAVRCGELPADGAGVAMTVAGFDSPAVTAAEEVADVFCAVDGAGAGACAVTKDAAASVAVTTIKICFIVRLSIRENCILVANRSSAGKLIVKALQRGGETPIPQPYPRTLHLAVSRKVAKGSCSAPCCMDTLGLQVDRSSIPSGNARRASAAGFSVSKIGQPLMTRVAKR